MRDNRAAERQEADYLAVHYAEVEEDFDAIYHDWAIDNLDWPDTLEDIDAFLLESPHD